MTVPRGSARATPVPRRAWLVALAALTLGLVTACGSGGGTAAPSAAPSSAAPASQQGGASGTPTLTVVASTNVWGDVASQVAGPDAQVRSIITSPATDPHSYEATPADAAAIGEADLVVYNGGGYDEWADRALEANPGAQQKAIQAYALRPDQSEENEHVWFDPTTVSAVARQIAQRLGQADPAQAAAFAQRADAFSGQVQQIGQRLAAIGQARPGLRGLSSEPVPFYLERTAGIADATPEDFAEAIEAETDPPAAAVAAANQLLATRGVNVFFFNPQTATPVTQDLSMRAQQAGVPVVEVGETLPVDTEYLQWLSGLRQDIATAVGAPR